MSLKSSFLYSQISSKLVVEGLPDLSLEQKENIIGIISSWKLSLVGSTELEGKLKHLKALMVTVLPYARLCLSNSNKTIEDKEGTIRISSLGDKHQITLKSSQKGIEPLIICLDDAELADLVRCLDSLKNDQRVKIDWTVPSDEPLDIARIPFYTPTSQRLGVPIAGIFVALVTTYLLLLMPVPYQEDIREDQSNKYNHSLSFYS